MRHRGLICALAVLWAVAPVSTQAIAPDQDSELESVIVTGRQIQTSPSVRVVVDTASSHAAEEVSHEIGDEDNPVAFRVIAQGLTGELGEWYEWHGVYSDGRFRPTTEYHQRGLLCRDFTMQTSLHRDGRIVLGTACRESDGWHIH